MDLIEGNHNCQRILFASFGVFFVVVGLFARNANAFMPPSSIAIQPYKMHVFLLFNVQWIDKWRITRIEVRVVFGNCQSTWRAVQWEFVALDLNLFWFFSSFLAKKISALNSSQSNVFGKTIISSILIHEKCKVDNRRIHGHLLHSGCVCMKKCLFLNIFVKASMNYNK